MHPASLKFARVDKSIPLTKPLSYSTEHAAGFDLFATSKTQVERTFDEKKNKWIGGYTLYGTNLAFEIPIGYVGILAPKSSSRDISQILANSLGIYDSDYRGECFFSYRTDMATSSVYASNYEVGEQVGQMVILPYWMVKDFIEVELSELDPTQRGTDGHGQASEKAAAKTAAATKEPKDTKPKTKKADDKTPASSSPAPVAETSLPGAESAPASDAVDSKVDENQDPA